VRVFVDANVLARPVTRTLLIAGAPESSFIVVWSQHVEQEADRHLAPRMTPVSDLRTRFGWGLGPTGQIRGRFDHTDPKDRQVLADAEAVRAQFIVADDVGDFANCDLERLSMSAVAPDLFMSALLTWAGYSEALDVIVVGRKVPPKTRRDVHAAIGRQHPQLFAVHADRVPGIAPLPSPNSHPKIEFRGVRCVKCQKAFPGSMAFTNLGLCRSCSTGD